MNGSIDESRMRYSPNIPKCGWSTPMSMYDGIRIRSVVVPADEDAAAAVVYDDDDDVVVVVVEVDAGFHGDHNWRTKVVGFREE
jgi:hypothetical protein